MRATSRSTLDYHAFMRVGTDHCRLIADDDDDDYYYYYYIV